MPLLTCTLCKKEKPESDFTVVPSSKGRNGRHSHCRPCRVEYERQYRKRNPEVVKQTKRGTHYRTTYGITLGEYERLKALCSGTCWICKRPGITRGLNIDHSHKTGLIRGLICHQCNRGLRWFRDNPVDLRSAATYLETSDQLMVAALSTK